MGKNCKNCKFSFPVKGELYCHEFVKTGGNKPVENLSCEYSLLTFCNFIFYREKWFTGFKK